MDFLQGFSRKQGSCNPGTNICRVSSSPFHCRIVEESNILREISVHLYREEELLYLKLISAVTEDILSRGHFSDRFVFSPFLVTRTIKNGSFVFLLPFQGS